MIRTLIIIGIVIALWFTVPGFRNWASAQWLSYRHQSELTHLHYLESQGKIRILASDSEL